MAPLIRLFGGYADYAMRRRRSARGRDAELDAEAEFWAFAVAQRAWWASADQRRYSMSQLARETLLDVLGFEQQELDELQRTLSESRCLEVVVAAPRDRERDETEWARVMPWEYLLTAALPVADDGVQPTIVRRLATGDTEPAAPRTERRVLYVESAPGAIGDWYGFEGEAQLPGFLGAEVVKLASPSLTQLRNRVREIQPDVIHLAGVDSHHACSFLELWEKGPGDLPDGMVLRGRAGVEVAVPAAKLAQALCAGRRKPELIVFNLYNSAGDLGYEAVAAGAEAAVGFQHAVDDLLAESFLAELYRMLGPRGLPLAAAVVAARERSKATAVNRHGTGLAVWSRTSRWDELVETGRQRVEQAVSDHQVGLRIDDEQLAGKSLEQLLDIRIEPHPRINYALLHNHRPIFRRFEVRSSEDRVVTGLEVEVALQVGNQTYPCRLQQDIRTRVTDFRDKLHLPLLWELEALPGERAQTTLATRIGIGGRNLLVRTDPVFLQPVDLWVDDDVNRQWLPSFVLPRDPAVRRVIAAAQRYLDALSDDYTAGFDGYQSVDPDAADPYAGVDAQVQAIWNALVLDFAPRYVNPPPTFELMSQRLRTPTDLLDGGRGTCIDLALLLAACLEYVEIFAAIVLLEGHAFVAYWRSEDGYYDAVDQMLIHPEPDEDLDPDHDLHPHLRRSRFGVEPPRGIHPWVYGGPRFYWPVSNLVNRRRQLVPLEATGIPFRFGFWEAVDKGTENLRSVHDFHSLIDLVAARDHKVTPLPFRRRGS
jgi:hypothetical protein